MKIIVAFAICVSFWGCSYKMGNEAIVNSRKIDECIKKDASYLISESNRGYSRKMRIDSER